MGMYTVLVVVFASFCGVWSSPPATFTIGALYPLYSEYGEILSEGRQQQAAIIMAIDEINNKTDGLGDHLLPNTQLLLAVGKARNTFFSAAETARYIAKDAFNGSGVKAVLGPDRAEAVEGTFNGIRQARLPHLLYNVGTTIYSESLYFPNFVRVAASDAIQGRVFAEVARRQQWRKVTLFYTTDSRKINSVLDFKLAAQTLDIKILSEHSFNEGDTDLTDVIKRAKKSSGKIFIIIAEPMDGARLLLEGRRQKLFRRGTQIIGSDHLTSMNLVKSLELLNASNISALLKGYLGVRQRISLESDEGQAFIRRWRKQDATMITRSDGSVWCSNATDDDGNYIYYESAGVNCTGLNFSSFFVNGSDISPSAVLAYDATYSLAYALHQLISTYKNITRKTVYEVITSSTLIGASGPIAYSQRHKSLKYEEGDRDSGITYDIMNYHGEQNGEEEYHDLQYIGDWTTERGFNVCDPLISVQPCFEIIYNTKGNNPPLDGPILRVRHMPARLRTALIVLFAVGVVLVALMSVMLHSYAKTRLVKLSQPVLQYIILIGCLFGCVRGLIVIFPITTASCIATMWLGHLSFVLIFSTLLAKTWRVHRVMNSGVKKVKITLVDILMMVAGMIVCVMAMLFFMSTLGDPRTTMVTVKDDQEAYLKEEKCDFGEKEEQIGYALYGFEALMVLFGMWLTYVSRAIPTGVSDFSKIAQVIFSVFFILIVGSAIAFGLYSRPIIRQFIIAILFFAAVYRCLYLLFAEMAYRLLLGYDLDKNFNLSKFASNNKSVIDSITGKAGKSVASEHGTLNQSGSTGIGSLAQMHAKSWTEEVLDKEIELCKTNVAKYQARLLELQEMALSRAVLASSGSNPSSVEAGAPPKHDSATAMHGLTSSAAGSASIDVALPSTTDRPSATDKSVFMIRTVDSTSSRPHDVVEHGLHSYHLGDDDEGKHSNDVGSTPSEEASVAL